MRNIFEPLWQGRIKRQPYTILVLVIFSFAFLCRQISGDVFTFSSVLGNIGVQAVFLLLGLLTVGYYTFLISLSVKRLHDFGQPGFIAFCLLFFPMFELLKATVLYSFSFSDVLVNLYALLSTTFVLIFYGLLITLMIKKGSKKANRYGKK